MVGGELSSKLEAAGHEVVPIARAHGIDLLDGAGLEEALAGVDTAVDVTSTPDQDEERASAFFTTVATNLGRAATAAGVRRTVLLSILNVADAGEGGHYAAKVAQEGATAEHAPEVSVLRAAHFHEFAEQSLEWGRDGDSCTVADIPAQPVALAAVTDQLLEMATAPEVPALVELAGPRPERLVEMVAAVAAAQGEQVTVVPEEPGAAAAAGAFLASPGTKLAGPTFEEWLGERSR